CLASAEAIPDPYNHPKSQLFSRYRRVFGPKQTSVAGSCILDPISITLLQIVGAGYHYYMVGKAEYGDVFDSRYQHVTQFCLELFNVTGSIYEGYVVGAPPLRVEAGPCLNHNCADEECKKEEIEATAEGGVSAK